jgi:hypothetical protein
MQYASQRYRKLSYLIRQKLNSNFIRIFARKKWRRGRVLTNVVLRPGMPPWPSLWVVFGTSFTRSAALRNFNGGSPTSSTTDWHSASFSSSAFRSRQTSQTLLPSWPWLAALWSPSAALLLSAAPQTSRRHSRCLLKTEMASASSYTHSGLSCEHESSSCHGILLETLNWRSCLQSTVSQALLHFEMLPWPNLLLSYALPLRECPTQLLVQSWWRQCA